MYAKKYEGKCLLKFEDTNPEKCTKEYADAMMKDITGYLEIKPDKIIFISDDMEYMYEQAEIMLKHEQAFVCFCNRNKMQELRHKGIACDCRNRKDSMEQWKKMLDKRYSEGECTLRLKGDMKSDNQVMRRSCNIQDILCRTL